MIALLIIVESLGRYSRIDRLNEIDTYKSKDLRIVREGDEDGPRNNKQKSHNGIMIASLARRAVGC